MNDIFKSVLPVTIWPLKPWAPRLQLLVCMLVLVISVACWRFYTVVNQPVMKIAQTQSGQTPKHVELNSATVVHGVIKSSLYNAVIDAGLDPSLAVRLRDIFGGKVDFRRDIRPGDWFSAIYAPTDSKTTSIQSHGIVAAEISVHNRIYRAFLFKIGTSRDLYYTADGQNLQQSILRAPLKYERISSPFSYHRLDPVLHVIRPHYGVDYAAPMGTPVAAAANGYIRFIGQDAGYGNLVVISSFGKYETYYAHLRRFAPGLHIDSRVTQGQRIGYVGESGEATGPHLHFGIKVNGVWRNPRTVPLPNASPLPKEDWTAFQQSIAPLLAELDRRDEQDVQLASSENATVDAHAGGGAAGVHSIAAAR
jgi:murein DD-endopeptidase MepM/ murein hydrolase activator NlpD